MKELEGVVEGLNSGMDVYVVSGSGVVGWSNSDLFVLYTPA